MAEPYLSEIRLFSFEFPPKGWAFCDGQILPINQNQGLYSLLGTVYGGDGRTNFALPDLRARTPIHKSEAHALGKKGGEKAVTLAVDQLPAHSHIPQAADAPGNSMGAQGVLLANGGSDLYTGPSDLVAMNAGALTSVGGGQAHENMQPSLVLNFCIALQGVFPSPN